MSDLTTLTTIKDAPLLPPALRQTMARGYLEMAEANDLLGLHDLARYCELQSAALSYGGVVDLHGRLT